ncbi:hypothetical protein Desku_1604 [Desulfofundulus kuznetsovii DSM 6115]|uniref:Ribbon-helix-helix protein CopG domain-containing protein n=1 Tax=Desulfofundulus kuznetsovii (strain DSM 6115 / VKM B-1805 / 17) TaxID=760568 RepID=A0AAU8PHR9_DESK7|nr:hypothetical protein Desku_1604 [Desulfofundulus kuznetsovii DSM 6115]
MKKTEVVSYRLPAGLPARLRQRAREEGRTITQVLADAIELYLAVGGREGVLAEARAAKDYAYLAAALVAWPKKPKEQGIDDFLAEISRQVLGRGPGE